MHEIIFGIRLQNPNKGYPLASTHFHVEISSLRRILQEISAKKSKVSHLSNDGGQKRRPENNDEKSSKTTKLDKANRTTVKRRSGLR